MNLQPLADRIVLVTGASRGIGYQVALEAARQGAHVIALARTVGGLEDLDDAIQKLGGTATLVPQDLRDGDAIDRLGAAIFERWGRLDGLVGNAAMQPGLAPVAHVAPKDFERTFAVNVMANYRLLRSLDLPLRQSDAGRAVFVTAPEASAGLPFWSPYAASKAALEAMVHSFAAETGSTAVRANLFRPAPVRSALRAKAYPGENVETLRPASAPAAAIVAMLAPAYEENGVLVDEATGA